MPDRAADELHATRDVSESAWARLARDWDEGQLVEIPFVVGQYTMLSMVAKATGGGRSCPPRFRDES